LKGKENIANNIRILEWRLRELCNILQTLPIAIPPDLAVALYSYQQTLVYEVKQQLLQYVEDDDKLKQLLQQRLFEVSLNELLWENSIISIK